jgi:hypothetical protein
MAESLPNIHTVYTDPEIGLIVEAWSRSPCSWYVLFQVSDQHSITLRQKAVWFTFRRLPEWDTQPDGGWADFVWNPLGSPLVPPAALAAVEAWLAEQGAAAAAGV